MKKIYTVIAVLAISAGSFAQTADSLLRRQMELERDFNPTLLDADKINSLPALREPSIQKANTNYSNWAGRTTPPLEIAVPRPGDFMTSIPFNRKRGYISLGAGNYANIDGAFGYRLVENENNDLTFTFLHNSTNGTVKYNQENSNPATNEAYFMDNEGRLGYRHRADALTLKMELSYLHSLFNYYGNSFGDRDQSLYGDEHQRLGVLNAKVGIVSHESDLLNYKGYIQIRNFSTAFGQLPTSEGLRGTEANGMVGLDKPFGNSGAKVGVDGKIFSAFYNADDTDNFFLINAAPYLLFGNSNSYARLGADVLILQSGGAKARVAPHVKAQWAITEHSSLYAKIHGGFSKNTFLDMVHESRYIRPYGNVLPSYSIIDIDAGFKIGNVSGFRFDIFGGYKKTDDEHFLVMNGQDLVNGELEAHRSVLKPIYGDLSHAHIGGMIQSNVWAPLDVSLRIKQNFYDPTVIRMDETEIEDPKAYNKPGFEADIRATFTLTSFLKLTGNYYFAGDRWTYYGGENLKMDNINDLNAGAFYQISDAFSINLRVNNLLSQKYDIWYGFPAQGINASGGFTFRF